MKNINLLAPINKLSYGIVGQNILEGLAKTYRVSLFPIGGIETDNVELVQQSLKNAQFFNPNAPCLRIYHQFSMAERVGKGKFIGFPIFELDQFSPVELHHLASLDEIVVCSKWAKKIILDHLPMAKVHVVPLGVDTSIFTPSPKPQKCVFFTCGKIEIRKSHYEIVEAFNKAFSEDDEVELWCMWHNPFMSKEEESEWNNWVLSTKLGQNGKIKIIPPVKTQKEVAQIMQQTSYGVFPSKAEGWCMPLLEMMACGRLCITTNYSGQTEFANSTNSVLIEPEFIVPAYAPPWFHGQGNWCNFDINVLYLKMRQLFLTNHLESNNPRETALKFTWNNTINELNKIL